jgi:hypothetical protein
MKHEQHVGQQVFLAVVAMMMVVTGCGAPSKVAAVASPSPTASAPTPAQSSSPSPAQPSYAVHLTFSGGLSAAVTKVQIDPSSSCAAGKISVGIIYKGQAWSMSATVNGYHGPGSYDASSFNLMLYTPSYDIWMSTSGSATYSAETSLSVSVDITNLMAGPGEPGATAHVSGTISC